MLAERLPTVEEVRHSQSCTDTTGPGCSCPSLPSPRVSSPYSALFAMGLGQSTGLQAGWGQLVGGRRPAQAQGMCHGLAEPPHMFSPQPSSLKSFPTSRAWCFTEIPAVPFPELPCWRATQSHQMPGGYQRPALVPFPLGISHTIQSPTTRSEALLGPPRFLSAAGPTRHQQWARWAAGSTDEGWDGYGECHHQQERPLWHNSGTTATPHQGEDGDTGDPSRTPGTTAVPGKVRP